MPKTKLNFILILAIFLIGTFIGLEIKNNFSKETIADNLALDEQEATIRAIQKVNPAVVNIEVDKDEPFNILNPQTGAVSTSTEIVALGNGTGFLISKDGYVLTNRHVLSGTDGKTGIYKITLSNGKKYYAQYIDQDPLKDLAVLKIFDKNLPYVELGDSDKLQLGTTVIAIGNTLGRYKNSATKGIISGLKRSLDVYDPNAIIGYLDNILQTDAEINKGNSGGPLIGLDGKVVGINVALDAAGNSVGFSIPINDAKPAINSILEKGRIIRPSMGVRHIMITPEIAKQYKLSRESGAWVNNGVNPAPSVVAGTPAQKAGILEGDIIFEVNGIKVDGDNSLTSIIFKYKPGDKVNLKIQRGDKVLEKNLELVEYKIPKE